MTQITYHTVKKVDVIVLTRRANGQPEKIEHRCRDCGRLVTGKEHV